MNIWPKFVPDEKADALREIAKKPDNFYTGYVRMFITSDGEEYQIDTRYDDDLVAAGIIHKQRLRTNDDG